MKISIKIRIVSGSETKDVEFNIDTEDPETERQVAEAVRVWEQEMKGSSLDKELGD